MKIRRIYVFVFMMLCLIGSTLQAKDPVIEILKSELNREFEILKEQKPAVYYLDYRVDETKFFMLSANFGNISRIDSSFSRVFSPNMRVGSSQFDNTHIIKGDGNQLQFKSCDFPIEDNEDAIRQTVWRETDSFYKTLRTSYQSKMNKIKLESENLVDDFYASNPVTFVEDRLNFALTNAQIESLKNTAKQATALFLSDTDMMSGGITYIFELKRKYFVSSEGQSMAQNSPSVRVFINGSIRSKEGNEIPLYKSLYSSNINEFASHDSIVSLTSELVTKLTELKEAPLAEPFTGPAILSPEASGVFFHEIFGHRVEGHRLKDETDAQTFKNKVGAKVLPKTFSVTFDPQIKKYKGCDLNGYYKYDDQGIEGQRVEVVKKGMLNDFLMCRTPIEGFGTSNGHGRGDIRRGSVSRQSNMFITTSKPYSEKEMRAKLIKACKKQDLEYGYYIKNVRGGFTSTGRYMPNAFNVTPTEVYKVFADGRPDELVRGVDLVGTPLAMFSTITAAGDDWGIFNGTCGAESGGVPVATISPSIFVEKVETQKKYQRFSNGPLLVPPAKTESVHTN